METCAERVGRFAPDPCAAVAIALATVIGGQDGRFARALRFPKKNDPLLYTFRSAL
jgi:hypothetical protein